MEVKQYITLEVVKNDFKFAFEMPVGSTWGAAIDAAFDVLQRLNEMSAQSVNAMKQPVVEPEVVPQGE